MGLNASLMGQMMDHAGESRCARCHTWPVGHDRGVHDGAAQPVADRCSECGSPYHDWLNCPVAPPVT